MLRLLSVRACRECKLNAPYVKAVDLAGEVCTIVPVLRDTEETRKASTLGLGLPVLVRDDGAMSKDAVNWKGAPKKSKPKVEVED